MAYAPTCVTQFSAGTSSRSGSQLPAGWTCSSFNVTQLPGADYAWYFVYDAKSGQLVAVLYSQNNTPAGCLGGPSPLSIPQMDCTPFY